VAEGNTIGSEALVLTTDDSAFAKGLARAGANFRHFAKEMTEKARELKERVHKLLDFGPMGKAIEIGAGLLAGFTLEETVREAVKLAAAVEDTKTDFRVLLGDAHEATELFEKLHEFAKESPFGLSALTDSAKELIKIGVEADQIVPTLRTIGDLTDGNGDKLKEIVALYGRVRETGEVSERTMRSFLSAGIPLYDELARAMGVGKEQIKGLVSEGKVGFPDLQRAIIGATGEGGRFFGLLEERGKTFNGLLNGLKKNWEHLLENVGQAIIDEFGLKDFLSKLSSLVELGAENSDGLRPLFRDIAQLSADIGKHLVDGAFDFAKLIGRAADNLKSLLDSLPHAAGERTPEWFDTPNFDGTFGGRKPRDVPGLMMQSDKERMAEIDRARGAGIMPAPTKGRELGEIEKSITEIGEKIKATWGGIGHGSGEAFGKSFAVVAAEQALQAATKVGKQLKVEADRLRSADFERVKKLADEFNPVTKASRELNELRRIKGLGGFDKFPGVFDFERKRLFDSIDNPVANRTQGVAAKDSQEAVQAIITAQTASLGAVDRAAADRQKQIRTAVDQLRQLEQMREALDIIKLALPGAF
jgi:tape measure domain-containing protein